MTIPQNLYLDLLGEKFTSAQTKRSAYVSVERRGKVYHLYDAERIPLGRMCMSIARFIQGKHKPIYRHDRAGFGDICVIVNADKINLTGKKALQKSIKYHTGYVGNLKEIPYKTMILEKPEQLIFRTISKMLPKNKLREDYLELVKAYRGPTHPLTQFLPNFGSLQEDTEYITKKIRGDDITTENTVVVYETEQGGAVEWKDFKREIDLSYEVPIEDRPERVRPTPENKKIYREYKKHLAKLKRFKEYKVKAPKHRDIVEQAQRESVLINRDWKARKLDLQGRLKGAVPDDD
jgi:large subunit ribosomal protein L13